MLRKITRPRIEAFLRRHATNRPVLDIGCGSDVYGEFFPNRTTLDVAPRPGVKVDIVADAHHLSVIPSASYEVVVCSEVLEHLHTPAQAVAEMHRVLKPGGRLLVTTRFAFPVHDAPGDYYRFTPYGLRHLFREFEIEEMQAEASTVETMAVLCQRIGFQCDTLGWRPFKAGWFLLAQLFLLGRGVLTREYGDIRHTVTVDQILSSGYFLAARKPA